MNSVGFYVIVGSLIVNDSALSLIVPRRRLTYDCDSWKNEFFTLCHVAECERTCDNKMGNCPDGFHASVDYCRPGCTCAPGYVRDRDGICTFASLACDYKDLHDSFSRDSTWSNVLASVRRKNRRRRLRYTV